MAVGWVVGVADRGVCLFLVVGMLCELVVSIVSRRVRCWCSFPLSISIWVVLVKFLV